MCLLVVTSLIFRPKTWCWAAFTGFPVAVGEGDRLGFAGCHSSSLLGGAAVPADKTWTFLRWCGWKCFSPPPIPLPPQTHSGFS